jgi:hypothetical protein
MLFLVPLLLSTVLASAASAQTATFNLDMTIQGPALVTVGQTNVAGGVSITNNSTGLGPVTLTSITYHPSCADFNLACSAPENGVFTLSPTATGVAGTACAGQTFTATADGVGRYTLTPGTPVVLNTGANCTINFTFNVLRVPTTDAQPATPGVQTVRSVIVTGTAAAIGGGTVNGTSRSVATITVTRAQTAIATQVSSATVALGSAINDTATVTGFVGVPTGTVTFDLYGPNNPTCLGSPAFTSTVAIAPNGTATSASFTPTVAGTYRFIADYNGDANNSPVFGVCNAANETVEVLAAGRYNPLTPARILDTRTGVGGLAGPVGPGGTVNVQVAGRGGVPATGVTAVAMNVTVTQPTGDGFLTISPTGSPRPLAANLNFTPGKTVPNLVVVKLGTNGQVDMFNSAGSTHVIYDVAGWFSDDPTGNDGRFQPLVPARILDTRTGTGAPAVRLGPGASLDLQVTGQGGVPAAGAEAVVMNVAVTNTTAESYLTVHPTGEPRPLAANLNWVPGATVSNRVIAKLGTGGRVTIYNNAGLTDVIVDVNGWFTDATQVGAGGAYAALVPARILDTRTGTGDINGPLGPGTTVEVQVTGRGGVPVNGVTAVILNATVVSPAGPGYLTIFPTGAPRPLASDLNYATGEIRPNLVVVAVGNGGKVSLFTPTSAHVVFDVAGFFT